MTVATQTPTKTKDKCTVNVPIPNVITHLCIARKKAGKTQMWCRDRAGNDYFLYLPEAV